MSMEQLLGILIEGGVVGVAITAMFFFYKITNGVMKNNTQALEGVARAIGKIDRTIASQHKAILGKIKGAK